MINYISTLFNEELILQSHYFLTPLSGTAYAKPVVKKMPDKALYDFGDKVKLDCTINSTNIYDYKREWYKLVSNGRSEKIQNTEQREQGILSLESMTPEKEGTYKCVISRLYVNYSNFKLVKIFLKGKKIKFSVIETILYKIF